MCSSCSRQAYVPNTPVFAAGVPTCVLLGFAASFDRDLLADEDLFSDLFPASFEELQELEMIDLYNDTLAELEDQENAQDLHELYTAKLQQLHHSSSNSNNSSGKQHKSMKGPVATPASARLLLGTAGPAFATKPAVLKTRMLKQCSRR